MVDLDYKGEKKIGNTAIVEPVRATNKNTNIKITQEKYDVEAD